MSHFRLLFCIGIFVLVLLQSVLVSSGDNAAWGRSRPKKPHHLAYFFDPKTNRTLRPPTVSFGNDDDLGQLKQTSGAANRPNVGRRCDCKRSGMANVCSCCAGIKLPRIRFQREICTRFQYNLSQRTQMLMDVTMNGNTVGSQVFNFRAPDPQPFCIPFPVPLVPLRFDNCIKVFDMKFVGQNAHFCMDWSTRVEMAPLILLHFDCAQFGSDGISFLKPGQTAQPGGGSFPSVLQPAVGGGGGGGGGGGTLPVKPIPGEYVGDGLLPVKPIPGETGPLPVKPTESYPGDGLLPVKPLPESLTPAPAAVVTEVGPDANGNLPQVAAGTEDLDPVEDLKKKDQNDPNRCSRIRVPVYQTINRKPVC